MQSDLLPNFLIVGAAKCGTTAIAWSLAQHPQVYFSPIKEPKFISSHFLEFPLRGPGDDFVENYTVKSYEEYQRLFRRAGKGRAIGEGSVENLYYFEKAIPLIRHYFGDAKIVIVLRDPVDRAFSAYKNLLRDNREMCSFEQALELESERKQKNWEYLWYYTDVGFYSRQVQAYLDAFSRVKVLLFDDFRHDPQTFMGQLFAFLGVGTDFVPTIHRKLNASGRLRNGFFRILFRASGFKGSLYKLLSLNGFPDYKIVSIIEGVRHGSMQGIAMVPETRRKLCQLYRSDVKRLQRLIGRDLSGWLRENDASQE